MKNKIIRLVLIALLFIAAPAAVFTGCSGDESSQSGNIVYYCPMHPEVQSNKPGVCPICHMDLVLKDHDGDDMAEHTDDLLGLNERKVTLAGISTTEVKTGIIEKEIIAYSYLDFAEQNKKIITARFSGRIEKLFVDRTGEIIKKGQPLFEIYSPDLIQAQNDYLLASSNFKSPDQGNNSILEAARQKLLIMGVTEKQLDDLVNEGKVKTTLTYYSPFSGTIIDKAVQEGMYVNEGSTIYNIADMSELWSISEVLSDDLGFIKPGSSVTLRLQSYPGEEFKGRVDLIYPVVNPETRTVKVRSVFPNNNRTLKPNMYGETIFSAKMGSGIIIPSEAIIFTGKRSIVWVMPEKGRFQAREIKTGTRINGDYHVLSGLKVGEVIATEGSYLIDSEGQLKTGTSSPEHQGHTGSLINESENTRSAASTEIFNEVCPVLGNKVSSNTPAVDLGGKKIGFCCPGCDQEFLSNPEEYMKNLSPDGKKFIKKS
jgi:membrane fusion protein, copper/silver efflux system